MRERYKGFTFPKIMRDPAGDVRAQTDGKTGTGSDRVRICATRRLKKSEKRNNP
jgi:hypothetical protein